MSEPRTEPNKKSRGEAAAKPVHVIREGGVAASIWLKQSPTGYYYYDYSLSRSWKSVSTGKTGYSTSFFERHCEELLRVITAATAWIEDRLASATTTKVDTTQEAA